MYSLFQVLSGWFPVPGHKGGNSTSTVLGTAFSYHNEASLQKRLVDPLGTLTGAF